MKEKRKYKTIKWVLKQQIEQATKTLWTWQEGKNEEFTCIYKNYSDRCQYQMTITKLK